MKKRKNTRAKTQQNKNYEREDGTDGDVRNKNEKVGTDDLLAKMVEKKEETKE